MGVRPAFHFPDAGSQSKLTTIPQEGLGAIPLFSLDWGLAACCPGHRCHPRSLRLPSPLTTEEVVDDGIGCAVGIDQPVGEGEAGVDGLSVTGLAEHPKHPRAEGTTVRNGVDVCACVQVGQESLPSSKRQENQGSERESDLPKVTQPGSRHAQTHTEMGS